MTATLEFRDPRLRDDLATYLGRAARVEDGALRITEVPGAVALWVPVLRPASILDDSPLIVAVRAIPARIVEPNAADLIAGGFDAVVPLRGMLDRLARTPVDGDAALTIPLPPERLHEAWTGRRPPIRGWSRTLELDAEALRRCAEAGIEEVASATGGPLGQLRAEQVRTAVWTRILPDEAVAAGLGEVPPAGAAFALHALGFLAGDEPLAVSIAPGWWRIASRSGHVLVQRRNSTNAEPIQHG